MPEPTLEDLQKQLVEMSKQNEEFKTKIQALEKNNTETTEALKKARELNADFLLHSTDGIRKESNEEPEEDTVEGIVEEIVDSVNEKYLKRYKQ